jgi:HK97 family phage prohead protease
MDEHAELKSAIQNQVSYTFTTDQITFSKTELKGEKQAYVTGYISVPDVDLYDDVVTTKAMDSMLKQIQDSVITIDYEHEAWRDDNSLLPVAKIVEAKVDDRGLWVKAILNRHSPKFKALWGSIEDGFINAFSIAFKPLKTVEKTLGGTTVRLIDELKLLNVAFTGAPVNRGAIVTGFGMKSIMLKAIEESERVGEQVIVPKRLLTKFMEEKNMEEENKVEAVVEEVAEEVVAEEPAAEEKAEEEPVAEVEEPVAEEPVVEEKAMKAIEELKALVEAQRLELKDLKENDVFKSPTPKSPEVKSIDDKPVNMLNLVR